MVFAVDTITGLCHADTSMVPGRVSVGSSGVGRSTVVSAFLQQAVMWECRPQRLHPGRRAASRSFGATLAIARKRAVFTASWNAAMVCFCEDVEALFSLSFSESF